MTLRKKDSVLTFSAAGDAADRPADAAMDDGPPPVRMDGGGVAACHHVSAIRSSLYASGEVREVSWLKAEGDRCS